MVDKVWSQVSVSSFKIELLDEEGKKEAIYIIRAVPTLMPLHLLRKDGDEMNGILSTWISFKGKRRLEKK